MTGKIIAGPDAAKRMPIEVMEAFRGKRVVGAEVNLGPFGRNAGSCGKVGVSGEASDGMADKDR
jgi:hypothetical protein